LNLGEIIGNSFDYAKKLLREIGRLVVLIVLDVIPIINFVVMGYFAKAIRESPASNDVPKLEGYGDMFVQGLKVAVVGFLYMIIPLVLIVSGGFSLFGPYWMMDAHYGWGPWMMGSIGAVLIIVGIIVGFFLAVIAAIGIVSMIKSSSIGKAFAFREILNAIRKIGWGKYVAWLVVMFILGAIVGTIGGIPYIGWLISLIISPIYGVFAARSAALIYSESGAEAYYPPPPPPLGAAPGVMYCKFCGAAATIDAIYCQNCGQKIG
jgi:hypothetical protein